MNELNPLLKWVGGKRQLLPQIRAAAPAEYARYIEPFLGGGAVLFSLAPDTAVVNDLNSELINLYTTVRDDVEGIISLLEGYRNDPDFFYEIRALDRSPDFSSLADVARAARTIYLNKTCYNGLYRVNSRGEFNAPFGRYVNPRICDAERLRAVSAYFNRANITFLNGDYRAVEPQAGDFVYLDPPYDPVNVTSSFTGYQAGGFGRQQQEELKDWCDELDTRGVKFLLSNSATEFIRELYSDYNLAIVQATRAVNSVASRRGKVDEVLVSNYGR